MRYTVNSLPKNALSVEPVDSILANPLPDEKLPLKLLFCLSGLFVIVSLFWAALVPFDDAPDEWAHYYFNVRHLLETKTLPVSGKDDVIAYQAGRFNRFGATSARYSYVVFPPLNYLLAAAVAGSAEKMLGVSPEIGARLSSVLWGAGFCFFLAAALFLLTHSKRTTILITLMTCLIPQVIFISSYLNQDIHSLAISAFLAFACIRFLRSNSKSSPLIFAAAIGLLLWSKYNYFVYYPFLLLFLLRLLVLDPGRKRLLFALFAFSLPGILFFLRNYFLYGDFLGQDFVLRTMFEQQGRFGAKQTFSLESMAYLIHRGFFFDTFKSFFAEFGYLSLQLDQTSYELAYWFLGMGAMLFLTQFVSTAKRSDRRALYALAALGTLNWLAYLYSSFAWDYQAQGRYLFPLLVPTAIFLGHAITRYASLRTPVLLGLGTVLMLFFESQSLLLRTYKKGSIEGPGYTVMQAKLAPRLSNQTGYEDAPPGEPILLRPGIPVLQEVRSTRNALAGVVFWVSNNAPRTTNLHQLILRDAENGNILRESYVFPFEFLASQPVTFGFKRIEDSENKDYILELRTSKSFDSPSTQINTVVPSAPASRAYLGEADSGRSLAVNLIFE